MSKMIFNGLEFVAGQEINNNGVFIDTDNVIVSGTYNQNLSYTATQDCFMYVVVATSQGTSSSITIDGQQIYGKYSDSGMQANSILCPIKKGQTIVVSATQNASVDYIVYGLQSGTISNVQHNYSTSEQLIGTWIDGKPLYQRTIEVTNPTHGAWTQIISDNNINITGYVNEASCAITQAGEKNAIDFCANSNLYGRSLIYDNDHSMKIEYYNPYGTLSKYIVTIQYTKTTD